MDERETIQQAILSLEGQKSILGEEVAKAAIAALKEKLERLSGGPKTASIAQQRKQVTVLFADVSGFTAMSETMDHEEVSTVINSLWTRVDGAIMRHGGRIDKHIGDAVMALFGAPTAREDDPERAIQAALLVQSEIEKWKQEFVAAGSPLQARVLGLQLRIGINTGPALIGTIGTTGEYTAIGDTVNLASRVESSAPAGGILISHNTYRQVPGIFDVTALEPVKVKGKQEPVQVYRVNGLRPRSLRAATRGVKGVQTRMIGRQAELARLQSEFLDTARHERTRIVNIVAEAGTGKSRLLREFTDWLQLQSEAVRILKGRASSDMSMSPASLIRDVLSAEYDIQDSDSAAQVREKLEQRVQIRGVADSNSVMAAHFIGQMLGFDFSNSPYLKGIVGDAEQIRDLAFHYVSEVLAQWSREQTVVLLLEDVHWSDSTSLDLLGYLIQNHPGLRLLILCSTRATLFEHRPDWGTETEQTVRLNVLPLSRAECRELVAEILHKAREVPPAIVELVLDKAEGSPFYIEELINVLIEGGVIVTGEPEWHIELEKLRTLEVPATLTGLLQARLDTLPPSHREILQRASVVGRVFWTKILEQMQDPEQSTREVPAELALSLEMLRSKELIFQGDGSGLAGSSEYLFKNVVLHDVTYESVLLRLRRVYHIQVAEGLIRLGGERAGESAGRVGEHYEKAGELLHAAEWYVMAGRRAQDTFAPEAAANYYSKALTFIGSNPAPDCAPLRLEAFQRMGEVLIWQARYTEATSNYRSMLDAAAESNDRIAQSRALLGLAACLTAQGDPRGAMEHAVHAAELAREVGAQAELAKALWAQGSSCYRLAEGQEALARAEEALAINTELNEQNEMARCLNLLGAANYSLGRYEDSERNWEEALRLFQELGDRRKGMDLLNNLGVIADARGDYEMAFQRYDKALEIAREMGYRDGEIVFLSNRGGEQVALGNYEAAEADLSLAIELAGTAGSYVLPNTHYYLAEAALRLGKLEQALEAARTSLTLAKADGAPENIGAAYRALGEVSSELGQSIAVELHEESQPGLCSADDLFNESLKVLEEGNMDGERARTLREWARCELRSGRREHGIELWESAREIFGRLGARLEFERMQQIPA